MKIVIVGGVAGGASAAARARRLGESAEIVLFERGETPSFANCGMPYYIGGEIESRDRLIVAPQARLERQLRLDVRNRTDVTKIDRAAKTVSYTRLGTGETGTESYGKLILSPGARPFCPPISGIDSPGIYTLRDLSDADRLHAATANARSVTIVGAGFIGIELAENFLHRQLHVSLVELADQILPPWDREMTTPMQALLINKGVDLRLCDSAESFEPVAGGVNVGLKSGGQITSDFVVLCIGVRPENQLALDAGLEIADRGGIITNGHMQTSDPDIYAVGDAVQVTEFVSGLPVQIPLAGPANRQGRIAADHIFGRNSTYRGTQGTSVVGFFDKTIAMTGLSEKLLQRMETPYQKIYVHPAHHAGYYPGAESMTLKLLFDPEMGKILGGQVVGGAGVDKRIDVLAMAIQADMTVYDLEEAELCYAPQFGSAKDPINMAGFVAAGVLRGDQPVKHASQLENDAATCVLDVRSTSEFADDRVPGAVNIPLEELRHRLDEVPRDRPIVTYCKVGMRGYLAARILLAHDYDVWNLSGGLTTYRLVHPVDEAPNPRPGVLET